MNYTRTASYVGLSLGLWDLICSFRSELDLIWRHPLRELNAVKVLYIVTRYSPFLIHVATVLIVPYVEHYLPSTPTHICRLWLLYATACSEWTLGLLVINLMLRVYALYNRNPYIILTTIGLLLGKMLNLVLSVRFLFPRIRFTSTCVPLNDHPSEIMMFMWIEVFIQGVPVYLTFIRSSQIAHAIRGTSRVTLIAYLRRGGALSWGGMTLFSIGISGVALYKESAAKDAQQIVFPIFVTVVSSFGCHLILQLRKPDAERSSGASFALDTYDSAWDVQTWVPTDPMENTAPVGQADTQEPKPLIQ